MDEPQKQESFWQHPGRAWVAAFLVSLCCVLLDVYVASSVRASSRLFEGLGVQLPPVTLFLLATHPRYFALFFLGAAFWAIAKEFMLKDLQDR